MATLIRLSIAAWVYGTVLHETNNGFYGLVIIIGMYVATDFYRKRLTNMRRDDHEQPKRRVRRVRRPSHR